MNDVPAETLSPVHVWLVPTPVGNLGDITLRAIEVLRQADAVACEDTRRSGQLLTHLGVSKPLVRLDAHTMKRARSVLEQYPRLAYVSDAGTPGISDPGAELLALALELGGRAEVLPGATAFVPALVLSGLDGGRFTFEGFLPRSGRERRERLKAVSERPETSLIYESPHRLHATLQDLAALCGPERRASVTRELSKKFEETVRGTLLTLAERFAAGVKGEIVVALQGAPVQAQATPDQGFAEQAAALAAEGKSVREIRELLQRAGLRKNDAYELALHAAENDTEQNTEQDAVSTDCNGPAGSHMTQGPSQEPPLNANEPQADLSALRVRQGDASTARNRAGVRRIAVLTSGGDAPGMNAAIRAVVRSATFHGIEVVGVRRGFQGLHEGDLRLLGPRDVANIIQRGGTILLTARSHTWRSPEGRTLGANHLKAWGVEGLIVIGGDGSFHGAHYLQQEHGIPVIGVPGTIDNDLYGTDHTIGYFTAVETALDAVDKLRDTAASHERIFVVEVMGRHAGHIALDVAVAGGAEEVFLPEDEHPAEHIAAVVRASAAKGKASSILIVAEGYPGGGAAVTKAIEAQTGLDTRLTILGHIQRGGSPVSSDRVLASRLGEAAVLALMDGKSDVMVGRGLGGMTFTPLNETWEKRKDVSRDLYRCAKTLSV